MAWGDIGTGAEGLTSPGACHMDVVLGHRGHFHGITVHVVHHGINCGTVGVQQNPSRMQIAPKLEQDPSQDTISLICPIRLRASSEQSINMMLQDIVSHE